MNDRASVVIVILPYFVSIFLKISALVLDPKAIRNALRNLSALPKPSGAQSLSGSQMEVVLKHVSHYLLKDLAILTVFAYTFGAVVVVVQALNNVPWIAYSLLVFLALSIISLWWVLPRQVGYFEEEAAFGISRGTLVVLLSCAYDVLLATMSLLALHSLNRAHK